ncbi:serpin family protein [Streptosporangium sandarakinum]
MVLGGSQGELVAAVNALTARWAAACSGESSTVLAGAGVWPLLAYLASAADGPGRGELERAVGVDAAGAARAAGEVLAILDGSPAVRAALGLWTGRGLPLRPSWTAALPEHLRGELTGVPEDDRAALDAWAADRTGGLIRALPVSVTGDTRLVLAGALTVRTAWRHPFLDEGAEPAAGPWAGRSVAVLRRTTRTPGRVRVAGTPAGPLTALRIEGDGEVDVHLLLGEESRTAGEVLTAGIGVLAGRHPAVDGDALAEGDAGPGVTVSSERSHEPGDLLAVTVPRFTVASSHDLTALPEVFGLAAVTGTGRGHFPGISDEPLAVGQARQDAVATFSATGFEAAAVTAFGMVTAAAVTRPAHRVRRVEVDLTRPFGFLAADRASGLVLAAGWVAEPEAWNP